MSKSSDKDSPGSGKYAPRATKGSGPRGASALADVDSELIRLALVSVLEAGDAILVGTTRDGGAVAMQMYSEDAIDKLYASSTEELTETLQGLVEAAGT